MSLLPCRDCGHNCSTRGLVCPACGRLIGGRGWWITTIAWGVIASTLIAGLIMFALATALRLGLPIP